MARDLQQQIDDLRAQLDTLQERFDGLVDELSADQHLVEEPLEVRLREFRAEIERTGRTRLKVPDPTA